MTLLTLSPLSLHSQSTDTWTGTTSGNWATATNWSTLPTSSSAVNLTFGTSTSGYTLNNNLTTTAFNFDTITFNAGDSAYTISGNAFTLDTGITNSSTSLQSLSDAITLGAASTFTTTSGGGNLLLSGVLSGSYGITTAGSGTLTLSGTNTYTGQTTITGGTLIVTSDANLGTAPASATQNIELNGGTLQFNNASNQTINANRTILVNAASTITENTANTVTLAGNLTGSAALTINSAANSANTLTLSGAANTYTGTITENGGVLKLSTVLGAGATINKEAGAQIVYAPNSNTAITINSYGGYTGTGNQGADITYSGTQNASTSSEVLNLESGTTNSLWAGGYTYKWLIEGSGALQIGTSTQTANAAPVDYTAITNTGGITLQSSATNSTTLSMDGGSATIDHAAGDPNLTFSSGGAATEFTFTNTTTITLPTVVTASGTSGSEAIITGESNANSVISLGANNGSGTFAGIIQNNGSYTTGITKVGTGTQTLSGNNTYTGPTTVSAGTLQAGIATNAFGSNSAVTTANTAGATLDLNGYSQTIGSLAGGGTTGGNVTLGTGTLTTGGLNTSTSYAGVISGTGGLTKNGSGTQTLTGTNTYTGATTINAGTLLVNGSLANTSISVSSGATLGGSGTLAGVVTLSSGAIVSMGSTATSSNGGAGGSGGLTLSNGLTVNGTSNLNFAVGSTTNTLTISGGAIAFNNSSVFDLYLSDNGGLTGNQTVTLITNTTASTLALSDFNFETASIPSTIGNPTFSISGNNLVLNYTVQVPEPPTWTLIALAALLLAGLKFRALRRQPPQLARA